MNKFSLLFQLFLNILVAAEKSVASATSEIHISALIWSIKATPSYELKGVSKDKYLFISNSTGFAAIDIDFQLDSFAFEQVFEDGIQCSKLLNSGISLLT